MELKVIARIHTDFPEKFGIPRQSGLVDSLKAKIIFEPEYRNPEAVKGLSGFDYIWLLWEFEVPKKEGFAATVRPPRLGGNERMGVFATRSPFRPNPIGLSSVRLERIELTDTVGPVLYVAGADIRDNTPIFDIKPYLKYADAHIDATEGFAQNPGFEELEVDFDDELLNKLPEDKRESAIKLLTLDPRPSYQVDPDRQYGMCYAGYNIRFRVSGNLLTVTGVEATAPSGEKDIKKDI